ncbi:MAG TPA: hypothetical protein VEB40_02655 [Flavipsychrobacter sp.]|nr:hypothetical protein [Flavipsychrobacter sp.]
MKKIIALAALLLLLPCAVSAQLTQTEDPVAVLGNVGRVYVDGKKAYPTLTIPEILENPPTIKNVEGFTITHFCLSLENRERMEVYGPLCNKRGEYTAEMKEMLSRNAFGLGTVYVEEIRVKGPDGRTRGVNSITVNYR